MDLNIDNYNIDELLNLFNIKEKNSDINALQEKLSKSITIITNEVDNLPEDKDSLIEFYTKAVFKILNCKKNLEDRIKKNDKKEELKSNEEVINSNLVDNNNNIINRELINGGIRQPIPPIYTINTNKNLYCNYLYLNP